MSNAVCHHGAISFEFEDSILGAAIVAIVPPQTAHTDPDREQKCSIPPGNAGSRNRYPRTRGKLRESTEISRPHGRSNALLVNVNPAKRASSRHLGSWCLGTIFGVEKH